MKSDKKETVRGREVRRSDKALLFQQGARHVWLPLSEINVIRNIPATEETPGWTDIELPAWLADAKELEVVW